MTHDLSFYLDPPDLTARGVLVLDALAPLSMVAELPGHYFRSQPSPTPAMLYGMLENALGWHFDEATRREALKALAKEAKKRHKKGPWAEHPWLSGKPPEPPSGYVPLLAFHVAFGPPSLPSLMTYDDLWSQNLHDPASQNFFGGSRHYDGALEDIITRSVQKDVVFGDRAGFETVEMDRLDQAASGAQLNFKSVRPAFPAYYASPKKREYVVPDGVYRIPVRTTPRLAERLADALDRPLAPLYAGSNDGWVDASWEVSA
ncbi:MAG: hypothetical protein LCH53_14050 [Bacteroidetes bacterium]|nr:hypothetical protein [Bacteroidota bacterium]